MINLAQQEVAKKLNIRDSLLNKSGLKGKLTLVYTLQEPQLTNQKNDRRQDEEEIR